MVTFKPHVGLAAMKGDCTVNDLPDPRRANRPT